MVTWDSIDTVLLDMDGTLLDLHFDTTLWMSLLPTRYSEANELPLESARTQLFTHMDKTKGQLDFYCLDYWAEFTGLDVIALHHELKELIAYRPHAIEFLDWLDTRQKKTVLVTNAHRDSLSIKNAHSGLTDRLHAAVSCHDYGHPKESQAFWRQLLSAQPFDPARTLLIDDNHQVLAAAEEFGIAHLLTIAQPDSGRSPRTGLGYPALDNFRELLSDD